MMQNQITLTSGVTIRWEDNTAGGRTYFSDSIGDGVMVWDTCLTSKDELLAAIQVEIMLRADERGSPEAEKIYRDFTTY